ncbi:hypothetical protein [Georgenia muralis]
MAAYKERLDKARNQINRSAAHIRNQHPSFSFVPSDRPILGAVVTAEPYYLAHSESLRTTFEPTTVTTVHLGPEDLELLVMVPPSHIRETLTDTNGSQGHVREHAPRHGARANPINEEVLDRVVRPALRKADDAASGT